MVKANLSAEQAEILRLYMTDFLTIRAIAKRRGTTHQAVSKVLAKLRLKGYPISGRNKQTYILQKGLPNPPRGVSDRQPPQTFVSGGSGGRLHALQVSARVLRGSEAWRLMAGRRLDFGVYELRYWLDSLEIYQLDEHPGFSGVSVDAALSEALAWISGIIVKVEREAGVLLHAAGVDSVRLCKPGHFAFEGHPVAQYMDVGGFRIKCFDGDGQVYLMVDRSKGPVELEALHPVFGRDDAVLFNAYFDDLKDNRPPVTSEIWRILAEQVKRSGVQAEGLSAMVLLLKQFMERG